MSTIGISTACFYPMETEKALEVAGKLNIRDLELHLSTFSEISNSYLKELRRIIKYYDLRVHSVHPFYSMLESPMFFSNYDQRRFADGLEIYRQYFHAAAEVGAKYLVFHGGQISGTNKCTVSDEEYIARFNTLSENALKFGITLLHENVCGCKSESPEFCLKMVDYIGSKALFNFDNKQARRAGQSPVEFAAALSGHIRNIHISDFSSECDCVLPGRGMEDFAELKKAVGTDDEKSAWIIEVYSGAINNQSDLELSAKYLRSALREPDSSAKSL